MSRHLRLVRKPDVVPLRRPDIDPAELLTVLMESWQAIRVTPDGITVTFGRDATSAWAHAIAWWTRTPRKPA